MHTKDRASVIPRMRNTLIRILDRPGGRCVLGLVGSSVFRSVSSARDAAIFWDGSWFSREDGICVSDGMDFAYSRRGLRERRSAVDQRIENARDYWFYRYVPKDGDVVVDVGAGSGSEIGVFSTAVGPSGKVLAIEAHPGTFDRLEKTCRFNAYSNVTCVHCAIADKAGTVVIDDNTNDELNSISSDSSDSPAHPGHRIAALTLDEACARNGIRTIDYLKMNIEGAERLAMHGMSTIIQRTSIVTIACHDFLAESTGNEFYRTREFVVGFLRENGFAVSMRLDDTRPYVRDHVHAWRT